MASNKILIAITGAKRAGKNTLCGYLANHLGIRQTRMVSTVDYINDVLQVLTGVNSTAFEKLKDADPKWRRYQQTIGDMLREQSMLKILEETSKEFKNIPENILLINGTRYQEELDWIKAKGGSTIRIFNRGAEEIASKDPHRTEQNIAKMTYDWSVKNEGTLLDLDREAKWLSGYIKEKYKIT